MHTPFVYGLVDRSQLQREAFAHGGSVETNKNEQNKPVKADVETKKLELTIEELEPIVAPRLAANHNETLVADFAR
jgi:hypothetical protein